MKVRFVKDNNVIFGSDFIVTLYEDKDVDGKCYIVMDGRVSEKPPEYFTKAIYKKDFDFMIIDGCTCDEENCCCHSNSPEVVVEG